jgi:hypothetical protein
MGNTSPFLKYTLSKGNSIKASVVCIREGVCRVVRLLNNCTDKKKDLSMKVHIFYNSDNALQEYNGNA